MCFVAESQTVMATDSLEPRRAINDKERIINPMFLAKSRQEHMRNRCLSGRLQPNVKHAVDRGVDNSVEPVLFVIKLDYGTIDYVIRTRTASGL